MMIWWWYPIVKGAPKSGSKKVATYFHKVLLGAGAKTSLINYALIYYLFLYAAKSEKHV